MKLSDFGRIDLLAVEVELGLREQRGIVEDRAKLPIGRPALIPALRAKQDAIRRVQVSEPTYIDSSYWVVRSK